MTDVMIGQYSSAALILIILSLAFKIIEGSQPGSMSDRIKILVTIGVGLGVGLLMLVYVGDAWTAQNVINNLINGFGSACMASGLWTYADKGLKRKPLV